MRYSLYVLAMCLICAYYIDVYPMRQDDNKPPEGTPLSEHLKKFAQKKTRKNVAQALEGHEIETELEAHQQAFRAIPTRPIQYIEREKPKRVKSEIEKKVEARALRLAVAENNVHLVHEFLEKCEDPNALNQHNSKSTLHLAAQFKHTNLISLLLNNPLIKRDAIDSTHHTPLCYSLFNNHTPGLRLFLEHRCWVGPDSRNQNCLHGSIHSNALETLLTFLVYPIDPLIPLEPHDERLWLGESLATLGEHNLQSRCLLKIMNTLKEGVETANCDLLARLWGAPFTCTVPEDMCEALTRLMPFSLARSLVKSFPPEKREHIAGMLAINYARRHMLNLEYMVLQSSDDNQTPFQLAQDLNRPQLMQELVHPDQFLRTIHSLLIKLDALKPRLRQNPEEQDPLSMFTELFIYRLLE